MCKFCKCLSHINGTLPFIRVNLEALVNHTKHITLKVPKQLKNEPFHLNQHYQYSRTSVAQTGLGPSWDPSPIYEDFAVRIFVLLFSFPIFSDSRTVKIETENNIMKT